MPSVPSLNVMRSESLMIDSLRQRSEHQRSKENNSSVRGLKYTLVSYTLREVLYCFKFMNRLGLILTGWIPKVVQLKVLL